MLASRAPFPSSNGRERGVRVTLPCATRVTFALGDSFRQPFITVKRLKTDFFLWKCADILLFHSVGGTLRFSTRPWAMIGYKTAKPRGTKVELIYSDILSTVFAKAHQLIAVPIRIPNRKQKQSSFSGMFSRISFIPNHFQAKQKQRQVCTSHNWKCELEASFLIFITVGLINQSNIHHLWHLWPKYDQNLFC